MLLLKRFLLALTLIALVTWLFTLFTYRSAPDEFSQLDLALIASCGIALCLIEAIISSLFFRSPRIFAALVGIFCVVNVISGHLALSSDYMAQPMVLRVLYILMLVFMFSVATLAATRQRIVATVMIGILALGGLYVGIRAFDFEPDPESAGALLSHATKDLRNFVKTRFKEHPNVYLFSFDSILPRALIRKHFDAEEKAYHEVLDRHFRKFPNFFSDGPTTRSSLNLLLALDHEYMKTLPKKDRQSFYQGKINSPLLATFKANGYETTTAYASHYLGRKKGPYVDNYLIFQRSAVCKFVLDSTLPIAFFGMCNKAINPFLLRAMGLPDKPDWVAIDPMVNAVKRISKKTDPQILLGYVYLPGHTPLDYERTDEEKEKFFKRYTKRSKLAAEGIERMVAAVRANDPDGIILIFGDHGPWLTRRMDVEDTDNHEYIIQDRYGVYGGISPKNFCPEIFDRKRTRKFNTARLIAREIVACLSDNPEKHSEIIGNVERFKILLGHRYEGFLYEKVP